MNRFLSLTLLASALTSGATEINGIAYELNYDGTEAIVVARENGTYTGDITIPAKVTIDGKELPVTEIGEDAFWTCDGVTSVNMPASIATISSFAFKGCSSLKDLVMPEALETIGSYAFSGCTSLTNITFNESVTTIDSYAFQDCSSLTRINISDIDAWFDISFNNSNSNPLSQAHDLWLNGTKVTEVTIPGDVWKISKYALAGSSVEKITIGDNISDIGWYAFSECENLKEVVMNCSVNSLDYGVFYGDKALTTVTLPSSLKSIGEYVFQYCTSLKSLTLPEGLTKLGFMAFADSGLESITVLGSVNNIASEVFKDCTSLKTAVFASGIKIEEIPQHCFSGCTALTGFEIPATIKRIEDSAFADCSSISSIAIPASVSTIGPIAFINCTGLTRVDITDLNAWLGITFMDKNSNPLYLAGNLYLNNELLTDLVVPETVKSLKKFAFQGGKCLKSVSLPTTMTSLPGYAFSGCTSLEKVVMPYSISTVDTYAFEDDEALKGVCISDMPSWCNIDFANVQSNPLYYAHNLVLNGTTIEALEIPVSVSAVKPFSFAGGCFADIIFPSTVKTIGESAFSGNSTLKSLTLGSSLTTVGNYAFADNAALTYLKLPATLSSLLNDAFAGCDKLTTIIAMSDSPATIGTEGDEERHAFSDAAKENAKLYVPSASLDKYKETTEWSLFKNISGYDVENPVVVTVEFNSELGSVTDDKEKEDGIESVTADSQAVEVVEGGIIAAGRAEVYTVEGRRVAETEGGFVALPAGIYVVTANGTAAKVLVR